MLSDVQEKIILAERNMLLEQIENRDQVIEFLLDALEDEHMDMRAAYSKEIFEKWDLQY